MPGDIPLNLNFTANPNVTSDILGRVTTGEFVVGSGSINNAPSPAKLNTSLPQVIEAGGMPLLLAAAALLAFVLWKRGGF